MKFDFNNIIRALNNMITQFDDDPLISEEVSEMLNDEEGRKEIRKILNNPTRGEHILNFKGKQIIFYIN